MNRFSSTKRIPHVIRLTIVSLSLSTSKASKFGTDDSSTVAIYFKRGKRNQGQTEFHSPRHTQVISFNHEFQFKVTIFKKKNDFKKKPLHLILQFKQNSRESPLAKTSIDLGQLCKLGPNANPHILKQTMDGYGTLTIRIDMSQKNKPSTRTDYNDPSNVLLKQSRQTAMDTLSAVTGDIDDTPSMMLTTMDETTLPFRVDSSDEDDDDSMGGDDPFTDVNSETKDQYKQTHDTKDQIKSLQREIESLQENTQSENSTQVFLIKELQNELNELKDKYQVQQEKLKKQLEEERQLSQQMKSMYEERIRAKEVELNRLREQINLISSKDDSSSQELTSLQNKWKISVQEFEQDKRNRELAYEKEKKQDKRIISELNQKLQEYERLVKNGSKETQDESFQQEVNKLKEELQTFKTQQKEQKENEEKTKNELERMKEFIKQVEFEKLSAQLNAESQINEFRSQLREREQNTIELQQQIDEKIKREEELSCHIDDLEQRLATIENSGKEKLESLEKQVQYLDQQLREKEELLNDKSNRIHVLYDDDRWNDAIYAGYMVKEGSRFKTWKRRYFILTQSGNLFYFKRIDERQPIKNFNVSGLEFTFTKRNQRNCISIKRKKNSFYFYSEENPELNAKWMEKLSSVGAIPID